MQYTSCAYSSGDRAPVSGTGCEGSNPSRRTNLRQREHLHDRLLFRLFFVQVATLLYEKERYRLIR